MPPRIPTSNSQAPALLNQFSELVVSSPRLSSPSTQQQNGLIIASTFQSQQQQSRQPSSRRQFSTTQPVQKSTRQRKAFWQWLRTEGRALRDVTKPANYVKPLVMKGVETVFGKLPDNRPFPHNAAFRSQSVLSDEAREFIWRSVMEEGQPMKVISAKYSIDMRRVAAILRMKAIEKQWKEEGKPLAIPYAKAVMQMLRTTKLGSNPHEPINDVHVHSYTMQQIFHPTSESREFTRADAAKAFGEHILPVDKKMRIPELLGLEKDLANGVDRETAETNFMEAAKKSDENIAEKERKRLARVEAAQTKIDSGRFEFRFQDVNVEAAVGKDGRARGAIGWRYGAPHTDRKKGMVKIPTKVE